MELGFAGFADFTCRFHVRAVADAENIHTPAKRPV
jgi:hypothetical protein